MPTREAGLLAVEDPPEAAVAVGEGQAADRVVDLGRADLAVGEAVAVDREACSHLPPLDANTP